MCGCDRHWNPQADCSCRCRPWEHVFELPEMPLPPEPPAEDD